ncbi:MAG: NUDIX domain-containing protein [Quadrisphaera sp.]
MRSGTRAVHRRRGGVRGGRARRPAAPAATRWLGLPRRQLSLPAGHLDGGEDAVSGLVRELAEEVGIDVQPRDCRLVLTMHRAPEAPGDREYVDLFFAVARWVGEPVNAEPLKCSELLWVDPRNLPVDVVDYVAQALAAIARGSTLELCGWTSPGR